MQRHVLQDETSPHAEAYGELVRRLVEIRDLEAAIRLASWDQATHMPSGGAATRARQRMALNRLTHERAVDPEIGRLLDRLDPVAASLPDGSPEGAMLRVARRQFEIACKLPQSYVARAAEYSSQSYDAWTRARPANDFAALAPFLEQSLALRREYADYFAPYDHIADPLIDAVDEGQTVAATRRLFAALRDALVPMARAIFEQTGETKDVLAGHFPAHDQMVFCRKILSHIGYDLNRGRLDTTLHPFCTSFGIDDVRITTRIDEADIRQALYSTIHEAGHGMYEQGPDSRHEGTPIARGYTAGIHESQSRLWENIVARSRGFSDFLLGELRAAFPDPFDHLDAGQLYRAINIVEPSLIRAEADEVTYNLHVMLRFDLEADMLEGRLAVKDLPEAWNARMESDLGIRPPDDRDGCLQDVHWFSGGIGGQFQGYTIGNVLAAQFYRAAVDAVPGIPDEISRGNVSSLHGWLTDNIYHHGRIFPPNALIERATGSPLSPEPYLAYMREKYGALYVLPDA